jgi:hypothetical protein
VSFTLGFVRRGLYNFLGEGAAMTNRVSIIRIASAVGLIVSLVTAAMLVLRALDAPVSKPTVPTRPAVAWRAPTHLPGSYYSEGLVTEYHEKYGYPLPIGLFTVVVDGVEYRVQEPYGALPTPIKPGYYQVFTDYINSGVMTVILGQQGEADVVSGFIMSERLVAPRK